MGRPAIKFDIHKDVPVIRDDTPEFPDLMPLTEAAEFMKCSARHLRDAIVRGDLPHFKIGRGYKVARKDLIDYALSRRVAHHAPR